ncbi:MAG: NTP transferase domain-containing protein [Acidimicrobiia bacterium]|nr:NTP transferase domain-containing protein [Acidimicrobiia bacterium]MDH5521652.1 NTP transferase domain-containing protein [Acidimicrobiia bacterium]
MQSARPKPIHLLCGRAMASYVLDTLDAVGIQQAVVVTGPNGGRVSKRLLEEPPDFQIRFVEQKRNLGNGDAALIGLNSFDDVDDDDDDVVFVPADLPLLQAKTVNHLLAVHRATDAACTLLTAAADHPLAAAAADRVGAGQVTRDRFGRVRAVVNDYDVFVPREPSAAADPGDGVDSEGLEIALGVLCVRRSLLAPALRRCQPDEATGHLPMSGIVEVLTESGHSCETAVIEEVGDLIPVDDRVQLADAEAELRRRTNRHWLSRGVTMVDPERTYLDATVELGTDVTIFPGTILQGKTVIGNGCELGPDVHLDRCQVGENTRIAQSSASLAAIGANCVVGPYAALPPGSTLADGTNTGAFYAGSGSD